jgi:hypothetical protein
MIIRLFRTRIHAVWLDAGVEAVCVSKWVRLSKGLLAV